MSIGTIAVASVVGFFPVSAAKVTELFAKAVAENHAAAQVEANGGTVTCRFVWEDYHSHVWSDMSLQHDWRRWCLRCIGAAVPEQVNLSRPIGKARCDLRVLSALPRIK